MRATDFFQCDVTLPGLIAAVWKTGWHQCTIDKLCFVRTGTVTGPPWFPFGDGAINAADAVVAGLVLLNQRRAGISTIRRGRRHCTSTSMRATPAFPCALRPQPPDRHLAIVSGGACFGAVVDVDIGTIPTHAHGGHDGFPLCATKHRVFRSSRPDVQKHVGG